MTVAVVGLGAMGSRIAARLLEAGHQVVVWNRSFGKAKPLRERGATVATTPADAAMLADVLITVVADPAALRAVSDGSHGIAAGADAALTLIEMSTVGPEAVAELAAKMPVGAQLLDAPVLGGIAEAEAGTLTVFAGGPDQAVAAARPLLEQLGTVHHVGPLGSGAAAKLVANAALFGSIALVGEAIALARRLGLPDEATYDVLATTPLAGQAERRRQSITNGEYPRRFALSLARKDADLIRAAARRRSHELGLLEATRRWLIEAEAAGWGERDYTAMLARIVGERDPGQTTNGDAPVSPIDYDGLLVDLDGVVWRSGVPIDGAADAIAALRARGTRILFLTNDPSSSREQQAARLVAIGISARADDIVTSANSTARFLVGSGYVGRRAYVIGSAAFKEELADERLQLVDTAEAPTAELVVVGGHSGFDFAELRAATRAVANGAELYAAGRDRVVPGKDGPEPATGAILAAVETATGVVATVVGKPEPYMFVMARNLLRTADRVAVVGDNLVSDIAGAKRAGLDAILVLTGTSTRDDVADADYAPDLVLDSIADLARAASSDRGERLDLSSDGDREVRH
jgi:HAD superfamily hydrolase (TIGR01450 family)